MLTIHRHRKILNIGGGDGGCRVGRGGGGAERSKVKNIGWEARGSNFSTKVLNSANQFIPVTPSPPPPPNILDSANPFSVCCITSTFKESKCKFSASVYFSFVLKFR